MTFEIFEEDLPVLKNHAFLAAESGSIICNDRGKFKLEERYIVSQIPQLYEYFMIDSGEYLWDDKDAFTGRTSEKTIIKLSLSDESAEKYYWLQHSYNRLWALTALVRIYNNRQCMIEIREKDELSNKMINYKYPFNTNEWKYSNLKCPFIGNYKGYHIDVNYPISDTIADFFKLNEIID